MFGCGGCRREGGDVTDRTRKCKGCGEEKPIDAFEPWDEQRGRYRRWCRVCWAKKKPVEISGDMDHLDLLEQAIHEMKVQGRPDGELMENCLKVWREGKFPDGSKVESESTRSNALKLLMGGIGSEFGQTEYKVDFVLDAKLVCSKCGREMKSDERVTDEEIEGMFTDTPIDDGEEE